MSSGQMIRLMVAVPSSSISTDMPRNPAASQGLVPLCINQVAAGVSEHVRRHTAFEERLSDQMVVPARLLTVTYTFNSRSRSHLLFPRGWTTRKR